MNKRGEIKPWVLIVGALFLAYLFVPSVGSFVNGLFKGEAAPAAETGTGALRPDRCYIEDTTLTVGPAERMFVPTTKATTSYHRVFKNGVDKGLYADGATLTVNPGDKLAIYWAENDTTYYAAKQEFSVPCAGEVTAGEMPDSNAYKLYFNGTGVTIRAFNTNNGNLNSVTDNQTLAAGDVKTMPLEIEGVYQKAVSPYGKIIAVIEGNKSAYDDLKIIGGTAVGKPDQFTVRNADSQAWAFEISNIMSSATIKDSLLIDVDDTVDPLAADAQADEITISLFDQDWFQNSDTGVMEYGVETNRDADVGFQKISKTIYVE